MSGTPRAVLLALRLGQSARVGQRPVKKLRRSAATPLDQTPTCQPLSDLYSPALAAPDWLVRPRRRRSTPPRQRPETASPRATLPTLWDRAGARPVPHQV